MGDNLDQDQDLGLDQGHLPGPNLLHAQDHHLALDQDLGQDLDLGQGPDQDQDLIQDLIRKRRMIVDQVEKMRLKKPDLVRTKRLKMNKNRKGKI